MRVLAYIPSPPQGVWHLGPIPIRAYALFIIIGIVVALAIGDRRWAERGGERGFVYDMALWAVPFGLVGGRLYHVMTDWRTYFGEGGVGPLAALKIWDGGLGIWGAVALGGVGAWIACRRRGIPLPPLGDAIAPGIILAQAIGRIGNYFNQELYGRATTVPWGLEIFDRRDPTGIIDVHSLNGVSTGQVAQVVHPTFLYELIWNVLIFVALIWIDRRFKIGHGRLFAMYVAGYCIGRFWIELLRSDAATQIAGIRVNSFTATFVLIGAVVYIILAPKGREDPDTLRGFDLEAERVDKPETGAAEHAEEGEEDEAVTEWARELVRVATGTGVVAGVVVASEDAPGKDGDATAAGGEPDDLAGPPAEDVGPAEESAEEGAETEAEEPAPDEAAAKTEQAVVAADTETEPEQGEDQVAAEQAEADAETAAVAEAAAAEPDVVETPDGEAEAAEVGEESAAAEPAAVESAAVEPAVVAEPAAQEAAVVAAPMDRPAEPRESSTAVDDTVLSAGTSGRLRSALRGLLQRRRKSEPSTPTVEETSAPAAVVAPASAVPAVEEPGAEEHTADVVEDGDEAGPETEEVSDESAEEASEESVADDAAEEPAVGEPTADHVEAGTESEVSEDPAALEVEGDTRDDTVQLPEESSLTLTPEAAQGDGAEETGRGVQDDGAEDPGAAEPAVESAQALDGINGDAIEVDDCASEDAIFEAERTNGGESTTEGPADTDVTAPEVPGTGEGNAAVDQAHERTSTDPNEARAKDAD